MRPQLLLVTLAGLVPACTPAADDPSTGPCVGTCDELGEPIALVDFDPAAGQLPEGLVVRGSTAYAGFAPSGAIARIDLETGAWSSFAKVPSPVSGKGFMTGLELDAEGNLYAALVSFVPDVQAGVYRVGPGGGAATLFASHPEMPFPNDLDFDHDGNLYVTDSGTGSVFRVSPAGVTELWARDAQLAGDTDACGAGTGAGFDIGANGLLVDNDAVFVANTDKSTILEIPRLDTGEAGAVDVFRGPDCANLSGADGIAYDHDGGFLVALNRQDRLVRHDRYGGVTTLDDGGLLDFPASLAWHGDALLITSFAFARASVGQAAHPALISIE
jgi:sugar lactone lactonase YvrE